MTCMAKIYTNLIYMEQVTTNTSLDKDYKTLNTFLSLSSFLFFLLMSSTVHKATFRNIYKGVVTLSILYKRYVSHCGSLMVLLYGVYICLSRLVMENNGITYLICI